jgi:hypothetical protein
MAQPWGVHSIADIYSDGNWSGLKDKDGIYARAVACPYYGNRLVAAWWVLTGRAFALEWPKAGDLENAAGLPFWNRKAAG